MIHVDEWLLALIPVCVCLIGARSLMHFFQLESYQFHGYFQTLKRNPKTTLLSGVLCFVASVALVLGYGWIGSWNVLVISIITAIAILPIACACGWLIARFLKPAKAKKAFVLTGRVKRTYVVLFAVMVVISMLIKSVWWTLLLPLVVALGGLLAWPIQKLISEMYFRDARRKLLENPKMIRIGITGSYGKTSVKHIMGTILSQKYPTLITPASFNTPMGVSRTIRERLQPSHQIFVGEMGARHVGDIKEMCRLVRPTIGVITSVGPQHLDTFKTVERVASTKYELIEGLPESQSHAYFADDGAFVRAMYDKTNKEKSLCGSPDSDCYADDVRVSKEGSHFTLHIKDKGSIECQTKLLGEHSIQNIVLASAVASDLHLSLKQISLGIAKLEPVEHRLQLINNGNQFTIINDAFNSNPVGAKAALKVLSAFPKRRIIITPGMVELGKDEAKYNKDFGKEMAQCADIAIVVGKQRALPIIEGLLEAGFPKENIHQVDSLAQSTQVLHQIVVPTDTVLYENDLPDHYQEA